MMHYGEVFNSFDELYNAKPFQSYPIGADRFEAYQQQVNNQPVGKALGTAFHGNLAGQEAGRAVRSGIQAAKEYRQGNKAGAKERLGSSLGHAGKAALRTAQIPLEAGKTALSRLAWYPRYGIDKFYEEADKKGWFK